MDKTTWVYRSGDIWLPEPVVKVLDQYILGDKRSLFYLNFWHINHFFSGVFFGLFHCFFYRFSSPWLTYFLVHTVWEMWQRFIGMTPNSLRGLIDSITDTVVGFLGLLLVLIYTQ